jgi:aspartate racemase
MTTIGLIGGMSWYSTAEYYRVINELVQERRGGHASAEIALQSVDFSVIRAQQLADDWEGAAVTLAEAGRRCQSAGADVVLICTNLMHKVADRVQSAIDVPLLHIADAIAERAKARGFDSVGVLGARWVMEESFYVDRLAAAGLTVHVPAPAERELVDRVIFDELTQGRVEESSRAAYVEIVHGLAEAGAQAVVLGCTEIEMLLRPEDSPLPTIDSMRAHAEAAARLALSARIPA